jgi:serine/threonine-protein kinase
MIEKIEKGWSTDQKFYIVDHHQAEFVLRVADISKYDAKQLEFQNMKKIFETGIPMSKPIAFGVCNEQKNCYLLVSYIKGEQLEIMIPTLPKEVQYQLGYQAGEMLKKIHTIPQYPNEERKEFYLQRIKDRVEMFDECGVESDIVEAMIQNVYDHIDLVKNRKQSLQHGDFHVGNLIINEQNELFVIDFNRMKAGDPYYEFNRIGISSQFSPEFAAGQIDGYFQNKIPLDFFQYLKFYTISVLIGTIPWSLQFSKDDLAFSLDSLQHVYEEFNQLKSDIPSWYQNIKKTQIKVKK